MVRVAEARAYVGNEVAATACKAGTLEHVDYIIPINHIGQLLNTEK